MNAWHRGVVLSRKHRSGDGFIACACGNRHWGHFGAAGLLLWQGNEVLLQHRAGWSHEGDTWAVPGGALDVDETPLHGALREAAEEAGIDSDAVRPRYGWVLDHGTWSYTTIVAEAVGAVEPRCTDGESADLRWVPVEEVGAMRLHSGFATGWPSVRRLVGRRETVVVDAANVVGSVPDGWWRDRVGAAQRLVDGLATLAEQGLPGTGSVLPDVAGRSELWPDWVVVLEGAARAAESRSPLEVVRADGSGDDAVVAAVAERLAVGDQVTVVTADRDLRERAGARGAHVSGPSTLNALLRR